MQRHSLLLDTGRVVDRAHGVGSACPKLIMKSNGKNKRPKIGQILIKEQKRDFYLSLCALDTEKVESADT